jgi:4-hydroxy-3-methylbut-2-enyl diphosphate reductase
MEMVLAEANRDDGPLYTFGPLIHNNQVLDLLESKGVRAIDSPGGLEEGRVVIRAHGIPPQLRQELKASPLTTVDATCPRVGRVQALIRYHTKKGRMAIIVGDQDHAEVIGLMGYSETQPHVIRSLEDVSRLPEIHSPFVVAQTTQNAKTFSEVVQALKARFPDLLVFDTICDATHHRQQEAVAFSGQVDAVVVVGGFHSGNTRRIVEILKETGMPTFHVETERDLNRAALSQWEVIGVTAGASTPNWLINNVVKEIEGIRGLSEASVARWSRELLKFLVLSNFILGAGAFAFAHAASLLAAGPPGLTFPLITLLYLYAMHVFNRFLDKGASAYNEPERAAFLRKHRWLLMLSALAGIGGGLGLAYRVGALTFLALTLISLLGIIYSVPMLPKGLRHRYPYAKIKDIPASRSLAEALAWAAVMTLLPILEMDRIVWSAATVAFFVVFLMAYTRSALFDLFQVQGDLIVGTETLPITLGEKRTVTLLKTILLGLGLLLSGAPLLGLVDPFSLLLVLPLLSLSLCLLAYERHWLYPGLVFEALVEGNFFLCGLLAVIWQAFA